MINLKETFKDRVSSSAFKTIDGELRIVGKYGQVSTIGDKFDVWFVGKDFEPIPYRRMGHIVRNMPDKANLQKLDGEAFYQTTDVSLVEQTLDLLGVRRRKRLSAEYRQVLAERVKSIGDRK